LVRTTTSAVTSHAKSGRCSIIYSAFRRSRTLRSRQRPSGSAQSTRTYRSRTPPSSARTPAGRRPSPSIRRCATFSTIGASASSTESFCNARSPPMLDKNDTILVTGAGGLVGSHVVELLEAEGFRHVFGLRHVDCDLTNRMRTEEIFRMTRPKHVFHAAARVYGIKGNMDNQGKSYLDNTLINTHVIDAAKKYNAEKITVMGTGAVYPVDAPGYHRSGERLAYRESHIFNGRPDPHEAGYAHAKRGMLAMLE